MTRLTHSLNGDMVMEGALWWCGTAAGFSCRDLQSWVTHGQPPLLKFDLNISNEIYENMADTTLIIAISIVVPPWRVAKVYTRVVTLEIFRAQIRSSIALYCSANLHITQHLQPEMHFGKKKLFKQVISKRDRCTSQIKSSFCAFLCA